MATYQDYLNFNTEEDKQKQLAKFEEITLSEATQTAISSITKPQQWLVAANPYCPDCYVFVPFIQKMAELNPNLQFKFVSRSCFDDRSQFDSDEQQHIVQETHKIPSLFRIDTDPIQVAFSEFPSCVKAQIQADENQYETLRDAYRAGEFNEQMEAELVSLFTS